MARRLKQAIVVFVVVFAGAQLIRPARTNPATNPGRAIQAQPGTAIELVAILDRSCRDCHSNTTRWPWFAQVAPASWVMAQAATKGRAAVNFSEWAGYSQEQQRELLGVSCQDARDGRMPGAYALLRSETRLSDADVATICAAARRVGAPATAHEDNAALR